MTPTFKHLSWMVSLALLVSGCASRLPDPGGLVSAISPDQAVAMAGEASGAGNSEKALAILAEAKKANPASKAVWLKSAQINFDRANYVQAIADAQEVLQRDGLDKVAQGLIVVSGLRLSTKAIAELVKLESLDGSTRGEAEKLARSLRESLGEIVLVPSPPPSTPPPAATAARTRTRAARAAAAAEAANNSDTAKPAKAKDLPACPPGNPFCGL